MRKIINTYNNLEGYNCFGCSSNNEQGLQMEFYEDGEFVVSYWEPKQHFAGYGNILHGGIQSLILDEIASWVVYVKVKTAGRSYLQTKKMLQGRMKIGDIFAKTAKFYGFTMTVPLDVNLSKPL